MVVVAFGLEEDGYVPHVPPEVGDGVAAVAPTRLRQLNDSLHDSWMTAYLGLEDARAVGGGAGLPQLLAPRLITDRRPYCHLQQI